MTDILHYLICPTCRERLTRSDKSLICSNRHTFDIAKSGYVNLLPPGKGKNAHTGDDRGMVDARVDFLKQGYYNNISDTAANLIARYTPLTEDTVSICDMGSGEGWHTCRMAEKTGETTGKDTIALGIDASKYAAERASKLSRRRNLMPKDGIGASYNGNTAAYFIPANIFRPPLAENTFSAAVSMFAPVAWEEAHRILCGDGVLLVVSSGREHLLEMRQLIYSEVHLSDEEIPAPEIFEPIEKHNLRYAVTLPDKEVIANLFMMTPFFYKTTETGKLRLLSKDTLDVTVDVNYTIYKKKRTE